MMLFKGYNVTSEYGYRKDLSGRGQNVFHAGIDLVKKHLNPIYAFTAGTVVYAGFGKTGSGLGGYGNVVFIKDLNGYGHLYAHLDSFTVKTGNKVSEGQLIGRQGKTGDATGSHLHYEIRRTTTPNYGWTSDQTKSTVEPMAYLKSLEGLDQSNTQLQESQHIKVGASFHIKIDTPGYLTATDAKAGKNQKNTVKAGTYFIYRISDDMINVTSKNGTPGSWINPNHSPVASQTITKTKIILPNAVYRANKPYPSGSGVKAVQEALASIYFYPDKSAKNNGIDGVYGPNTADAVKRFQSVYGLVVDGVYGPSTKVILDSLINK